MTTHLAPRPLAEHPYLLPTALGAVGMLHGIAHFAGVAGHLERATDGTAERYLGGWWTIDDPTQLRVLAAVWGVIGAAFVVAGLLTLLRLPVARTVLLSVASVSLALTVLALWAAGIGVVVNLTFLAIVATIPAAWLTPAR